ncbi:MAG: type III polyketide synthase [Candidatus Brocadia sp.]|nr:1,3,6,8-tetrahydroxynaphthalene synthase [Candidatus Brocadia fulgida]MCC6324619.1 type III polyketide synthase [Candidatus Brocadia sp.]MCE7910308.1 type III polyketide synthase [Candidatus Brocadia sp. AMX3]MDG5995576.1 type III polyketide synthase [Candidatus Brocadia sp.]RIK02231.1 MAG: type III polyketide synthase [Candidatus Brocadia sp.]
MYGIGSSYYPPYRVSQAHAEEFLVRAYADKLSKKNLAILRKIFAHPGIVHRHLALDDLKGLIHEHPDNRIARFTRWAVDLSSQAILKALTPLGLTPDDVSGLVVNTCTGYICPGISTYLIEKLRMPDKTRAHDLVGSGCGGGIPNLQICEDMTKSSDNGVVVGVSVEICSATFQMADDLSLILSNALFADGASASVLWRRSEGLELIASASYYKPESRDDIRYIYKNGQLRNQLSVSLPELAGKAVTRVITDLLKPRGLAPKDIQHWAFHPGGERVINAIRDEIGLPEGQLQATRSVLAKFGNMSSPTVFFVLREILDNHGVQPGDWCVMVAFGAGLCAHAFLLRAS